MVTMDILGRIVAEAQSRDKLLSCTPFPIDESIGSETRPEETASARNDRQRGVPVGVEIVCVASGQIHPRGAELVFAVNVTAPGILSLSNNATGITTAPTAEVVRELQVAASHLQE